MEKAHSEAIKSPPGHEVNASVKNGGNSQVAERFIDLLTEYICGNVTESLNSVRDVIEKKVIVKALQRTNGNQKEAARILGLKRTTLSYKIKKLRIQIKKNLSVSIS